MRGILGRMDTARLFIVFNVQICRILRFVLPERKNRLIDKFLCK